MNAEAIQTVFAYHIWANRQVWACVESISEEQFLADHDYSMGSIRDQVFHLLFTDWSTALYMQGKMPAKEDPDFLKKENASDKASTRQQWDTAAETLQAYIRSLTDEALQMMLSLPKGDGTTFEATLWESMLSIVNHGTNHRAQILERIDELGGTTVEQGLYFYMMQR